ncbi:MAG: LPP20 family lipoprotein [Calditrichia bacterium]|nr:LPP20 family lipoprotein [Calditrichia bacterium]
MKRTLVVLFILYLTCAWSQTSYQYQQPPPPDPNAKEVVAKGFGAILAGDEVKAREDAINSALRNAVEQVVGTMVESQVLVENYQTVEDKIYTRTTGYVQKYDIISTSKQFDNALEVTIKAVVKVSDLKSDLEAIGVLLSRKGKPRTMVMIEEKNIAEHYYQFGMDMNTTETAIMNELMNFGFPFVDPTQSKISIANDVVSSALRGDAGAAASIATRLGAEIVITGKAVSKVASGGPDVVRNAGFKSCQANINLRVIRADDAKIIAVASASDRAAHIDEITGGIQALQNASKTAALELKDKIINVWQEDVYSSTQVQLHVTNISSFSQLNTLKNSLSYYVRGIQSVHQRSFAEGTALFDIDIKGTAEQMASELDAKEMEGIKLQVIGLTQNKVSVKIVQPGENQNMGGKE